jgi:P-type Mg2+ transporter
MRVLTTIEGLVTDLTREETMEKAGAAVTAPEKLLEQLESSEVAGLTGKQVAQRRAQYGANALTRERATALGVLVRQFRSALIYFLMVAAVLAFATNDRSDGVIITIILLINAGLGFSQEYRSERAVEKLALLISDKVLVKRDSASVLLEIAELVPGDIVILKEGDIVPADIKLLYADNVEVDESQLTGESVPVAKAVQPEGTNGGDSLLLFTGSTVDNGELTGVVYAIANNTALGKIAALSTRIRKVTQYEKSLQSFSVLLLKIVGSTLAITLLIKIVLGRGTSPISELLIFVIALAVAVVPEALPVIATLTLSRGALKLAKEQVVVKRLSSLEDLGNVTLLCTDKTGTLTEGKVTIKGIVSSDDKLFQTLAYAAVDPQSKGKEGTQTAFDAAFVSYIADDIKQQATGYTIAGEIPFHPADRRHRVLLSQSTTGTRFLVVIGSAETLLEIADCPTKQPYLDQVAAEGQQSMRHLGLAYRQLNATDSGDILSLEKDLTFLGFATLADPLRAGMPATIAKAKQLVWRSRFSPATAWRLPRPWHGRWACSKMAAKSIQAMSWPVCLAPP